MGWIGTVFLGAVIGLAGWWLHPLRRAGRGRSLAARAGTALGAGILAAVVARMFGNVVGAYHDGDTLEWLACSLFAFVVVTVTVGLAARR
ncbi:hypothetical protein [Caballeronia telluris]|jgi:hypothetical protein|uniref:Membrane protein n=1 Tax=Caballeronia telluris TaxID=326475 RepID=A0A158K5L9_9BURK|nr:hypothetical protein [Caballeronia telluris]SAL76406.1 membrane protein [Caballeronia telluris]